MKICIFTDNHWSQYSSIVRRRGSNFSERLENQIVSLNWVVDQAERNDCDRILCLGDFFDKETLNSEEITALNKVNLFHTDIPSYFLVGNHETGSNNMQQSSVHAMLLSNNNKVIDTPHTETISNGEIELCYLPYTVESNRKPLSEVFGEKKATKRFILSHNDIAGIQYGAYKSQLGYTIDDIEHNCDMFINGHLHNGEMVTRKIMNLGNLTGQNFSEDAFKYSHNIVILDTDTSFMRLIENPYAFNFYKIENDIETALENIKNNAVVTVKINEKDLVKTKELLSQCGKVIEYRIILDNEVRNVEENRKEDLSIDHLQKFKEFVFETIGTTDTVKEDLEQVCQRG